MMNEQQFRLMGRSGALVMAFGITTVVFGIACGVVMIIEGARLLANRKRILF